MPKKKRQSTLSGFFCKPKPKDAEPAASAKRKREDDSPITPAQRKRMEDSRKLSLLRREAKEKGEKPPTKLPSDILTLPGTWADVLKNQPKSGHFIRLRKLLATEYVSKTIFPPKDLLFEAFKRCDFKNVRAVIVGQDPYHGPGQAHGLCFSVQNGVRIPPSLRNIYKELKTDFDGTFVPPTHGNLSKWADQGVLLLNTVLTVRKGQANSHRKKGWEEFTDAVIRVISEKKEGVVFLVWGRPAEKKTRLVMRRKHLVLTSSHPSPLGATKTAKPFIGCRHFTKANAYLKSKGKKEIDWQL